MSIRHRHHWQVIGSRSADVVGKHVQKVRCTVCCVQAERRLPSERVVFVTGVTDPRMIGPRWSARGGYSVRECPGALFTGEKHD